MCCAQDCEATLIYFDIDNFKQIKDAHGHQAGDNALLQFTSLLINTFRDSDLVGRIGNDEFVVLMVSQNESDQDAIMNRLAMTVDNYNQGIQSEIYLNYSFGLITTKSLSDYDLQQLYTLADEAMYHNKLNGQSFNVAVNIDS